MKSGKQGQVGKSGRGQDLCGFRSIRVGCLGNKRAVAEGGRRSQGFSGLGNNDTRPLNAPSFEE